jgi:hypothetical protein
VRKRIVGVGDTDPHMSVTECPTHGDVVGDTDPRMIQGGVAHAVSPASPASEGRDAESADGAE